MDIELQDTPVTAQYNSQGYHLRIRGRMVVILDALSRQMHF
jgi:hypothetical protein